MRQGPFDLTATRAWRALGRRAVVLLVILLAMPAMFVKAHIAIEDHHAPQFGPSDGFPALADVETPDETPDHDPTHPADDHVSDDRLRYTQRRIAKASVDPVALPPSTDWSLPPRAPRASVDVGVERPALPPPLRSAWPRGPPTLG